jgi:Ceramidase
MIDVYCERIGPGLLAEPLNALTNASYLIAAWAAWLLASRLGRPSAGAWVLLVLSVAVGIGSGLWHTFATPWAFVLDIVPIVLFLVWFFWLYLRSVAELSTSIAAAVIVAFLLTTYFAQSFADVLHGALAYTPALILLLVLGVFHARHSAAGRFLLLAAAGVFGIALVFRTLDQEVCPVFPIGTHFLWHSLAGLAAYLAMRCLILSRAWRVGLRVEGRFQRA